MAATGALLLSSCGKDYDDDINGLKNNYQQLDDKYNKLDSRVASLEEQTKTINDNLAQLSVLTEAAKSGFYITDVKTTSDGYELTLSNGRKIALQNGANNTLNMAPTVTVVELDDTYYWSIDGMLLLGTDGKPMKASGQAPLVKFNWVSMKWTISVDGGVTYQNVNVMPISINDTVLLQVINEFLAQNTDVVFTQKMLFEIITNYIQDNVNQIFKPEIINNVITNYIKNDYDFTEVNTYVNNYIKNNFSKIVDVDMLIGVIMNYIQNNQTTIINNDVLFQVFKAYIDVDVNLKKIFTTDIIYNIVYNSNINFTEIFNLKITNEELITIIENRLGIKIDNTFNINQYKTDIINIVVEHITAHYLQIFTQQIVVNMINQYKTQIFSLDLSTYIVNNYITNIKYEETNVFVKVINQIITNYFSVYQKTVINQYFKQYIDIDIQSNYITLIFNGQKIQLMRYTNLADMVQSIVYMPVYRYNYIPLAYQKTTTISYLVCPARLAKVIYEGVKKKTMAVQFIYTDIEGQYDITSTISPVGASEDGILLVNLDPAIFKTYPAAIALSIYETNGTGTEYTTTFTPCGDTHYDY
jgi:hypothetical protein